MMRLFIKVIYLTKPKYLTILITNTTVIHYYKLISNTSNSTIHNNINNINTTAIMLNLTNYIALFGNSGAYSINKDILMKDVILIKHQLEEYNSQENNIKHKQQYLDSVQPIEVIAEEGKYVRVKYLITQQKPGRFGFEYSRREVLGHIFEVDKTSDFPNQDAAKQYDEHHKFHIDYVANIDDCATCYF